MPARILALETSHQPGSIVLAEGDAAECRLQIGKTLPANLSTAQSFAPCIREMLRAAGVRPQEVGLVAIDVGPGSFTGLRIAVTFAKTFAYATGAETIGVSCMAALARQAAPQAAPERRLWTLVDAHRGQLFVACYAVGGGGPARQRLETQVLEIDQWLQRVEPGDLVTGPISERLAPRLPAHVELVETSLRMPSAATIAEVAWQKWQDGIRDDLWRLRPEYFRKSAAEERLDVTPP